MNLRERVMEAVAAVEVTVPKCRCGAQSFIPQGYEVCDLADATKVLIGETWCYKVGPHLVSDTCHVHQEFFESLGVLAIRPIPEPEPLRGESEVSYFTVLGKPVSGIVYLPESMIGKRIRWEVIE